MKRKLYDSTWAYSNTRMRHHLCAQLGPCSRGLTSIIHLPACLVAAEIGNENEKHQGSGGDGRGKKCPASCASSRRLVGRAQSSVYSVRPSSFRFVVFLSSPLSFRRTSSLAFALLHDCVSRAEHHVATRSNFDHSLRGNGPCWPTLVGRLQGHALLSSTTSRATSHAEMRPIKWPEPDPVPPWRTIAW